MHEPSGPVMILTTFILAIGAFIALHTPDSRIERALVAVTDEEAIAILASATSATSAPAGAPGKGAHLVCPRLAKARVSGLIAY